MVLNFTQALHHALSELGGRSLIARALNYLVENNFDVVVLLAGVTVGDMSGDGLDFGLVHLGVQKLVNGLFYFFTVDLFHVPSFSLTS